MPSPTRLHASEIAKYFLFKASEDNKPISNKKLQKLLYYSQAWFLVLNKKPLFPDKIEAWVHGPAIRSVYIDYKVFGFGPITKTVTGEDIKKIPNKIQIFLDKVWRIYGKFDAGYLEQLTHSEKPWQDARADLGPMVGSDKVITKKSMADFYKTKMSKK